MFHLCSHGSRDIRDRTEPGLEGAYALRQWLSAGDALHAQVHLPQTVGPRDAGLYARAELPDLKAGISADVPSLWESKGDGDV